MPGPPPAERRRRRNADVYADVQVHVPARSGTLAGPTLAFAMGPTYKLMDASIVPLVESWWATWRRSPLAATFLATDWQRLSMLAPLVASYYARPHYTKLAEIRQNESLLGATHVDRLRARIKVEADAVPAETESTDDRRRSRRLRLAG